jgi:hypothetical protein
MTRSLRVLSVPRAVAAGGWSRAVGFRKRRPPDPIPQVMFTRSATAPIGNNGIAFSVIGAGGGGTVTLGPSGIGCRWYPQQAVLSTTSGPSDTSTAVGYLGPPGPANPPVFTSYQAGGDTQGLAVPVMQPGDLLTVVWSGGHPGDQCTIRVIGDQDVLIPG